MVKIYSKLFFIIILNLFVIEISFGQFNREIGAAEGGMANSAVMKSDLWSNFQNQAGLANIKGISAGIFFSNAFHIPELGTKALAMSSDLGKNAGVGFNYTYFGYELYNESKIGLAYAMKLGKRVSAGIQLDWFSTRFGNEYGHTGTPVGEIGILSNPVENLYIGAHVFNPWFSKLNNFSNEKVPTVFRIGLGYNFSDKVLFTAETQKDVDLPLVLKSGIEYTPFKGVFLRIGASSNPTLLSFGAGYKYKNIQLDFAYSSHQTLGYTTQFGLSYTIIRKRKNHK
jgi:hypothetical protein